MKAHFVVTISANKKMELQAEVLIKSIKTIGSCSDSFFTIFTHQPEKISSTYLKNYEIIGYKGDINLKYPWSICARWNVVPKAKLVIGLDSDVVALRDLNPLLEQLNTQKGMSGVMAEPFTPTNNYGQMFSNTNWKECFKSLLLEFPNEPYVSPSGQINCPYYVNNGVLCLTSEYVIKMRHAMKTAIKFLNIKYHHDYFITQRANSLAAYMCKFPLHVMPKEFNHLEQFYGMPTKETFFFHYNISKDIDSFCPKDFLYRKKFL